ncbi:hypothetical protein WVI01_03430 [Weissella viridescens]|nr:hypothetical protein [Weissella viridescens]GEA94420.1 hypothetical protein WVI01_03430 [Weissella viridescens]
MKKFRVGFAIVMAALVILLITWVSCLSSGAKKYWFTVGEGNFQWLGISAVVAVLTLIINFIVKWYDNKIKKIEQVQMMVAEYLTKITSSLTDTYNRAIEPNSIDALNRSNDSNMKVNLLYNEISFQVKNIPNGKEVGNEVDKMQSRYLKNNGEIRSFMNGGITDNKRAMKFKEIMNEEYGEIDKTIKKISSLM